MVSDRARGSKVTDLFVLFGNPVSSASSVPRSAGASVSGVSASFPQKRGVSTTSQQEIVERAECYVRAHQGTAVPISQLCRVVGLSERGLRNAFHSVRGMSPRQYLLTVRLHAVRRALRDAAQRPTTVTGVATEYGFYELGRFAAAYREVFGEAPSETLRSACRGPNADS
jgi:AraC family transcriptional regulator, ethanolamine operon transcriptional activator